MFKYKGLLFISGGAYKAGDRVVLGISQLEREGSLREPGLSGSIFIATELPSRVDELEELD